jgi:hypothetical protein
MYKVCKPSTLNSSVIHHDQNSLENFPGPIFQTKKLWSIIFTLILSFYNKFIYYVRFEVSTVVTMMIIIFWEMTPCGSYKNRRFGGSYRLHLQGARVRAGYRAKLLAIV